LAYIVPRWFDSLARWLNDLATGDATLGDYLLAAVAFVLGIVVALAAIDLFTSSIEKLLLDPIGEWLIDPIGEWFDWHPRIRWCFKFLLINFLPAFLIYLVIIAPKELDIQGYIGIIVFIAVYYLIVFTAIYAFRRDVRRNRRDKSDGQ
jgi:hypothetical protein